MTKSPVQLDISAHQVSDTLPTLSHLTPFPPLANGRGADCISTRHGNAEAQFTPAWLQPCVPACSDREARRARRAPPGEHWQAMQRCGNARAAGPQCCSLRRRARGAADGRGRKRACDYRRSSLDSRYKAWSHFHASPPRFGGDSSQPIALRVCPPRWRRLVSVAWQPDSPQGVWQTPQFLCLAPPHS